MVKRIFILLVFFGCIVVANSQKITTFKINDVVKYYSAKNDTVYIINFWATFCKPCIEEIPDFIKLVEQYKSKKVKLLLVSVDLPSYLPKKLPEFIKANKFNTNHAWLNETNADYFCPKIDEKWSGAIPSTLIVNNKKKYRKFFESELTAVEFEKALLEAIQ
ncbi:MAG: TlpA family protein disulfide reductase [Chitinophagaceae bacterium]|nr:TlpA family protein disulfide reductase [Chitinophagaceae bacterium]